MIKTRNVIVRPFCPSVCDGRFGLPIVSAPARARSAANAVGARLSASFASKNLRGDVVTQVDAEEFPHKLLDIQILAQMSVLHCLGGHRAQ